MRRTLPPPPDARPRRRTGSPAPSLVRQELARLEAEVALCERCYGPRPRLPARFERPGGRGRVLVLGERPARTLLEDQERLGPGNEDPTSRFLGSLLDEAGIPPGEVVAGAAVLCRPASRDLETAVPISVCVRECSVHVRELVRAAGPRLILPLGARALQSLRVAFPTEETIRRLRFPASVGRTVEAGTVWIHPLYHVTVRARVTRPEPEQRRDWRRVGRLWQWIGGGERGPRPGGGTGERPDGRDEDSGPQARRTRLRNQECEGSSSRRRRRLDGDG